MASDGRRARRFEAVIFDLDGVLVDSEPLHYRVMNDILLEHGVTVSWEDYLPTIGTTFGWADLWQKYGLPRPPAEYSQRYWGEIELRIAAGELAALPGVYEAIAWAQREGLRLGLASSSRRGYVLAVLQALGLAGAFSAVVCREDVPSGKPDPAPFLEAARQLGVEPRACLVIEDSPAGIAAAKAAGMYVIAVRTAYSVEAELAKADMCLDALTELPFLFNVQRVNSDLS